MKVRDLKKALEALDDEDEIISAKEHGLDAETQYFIPERLIEVYISKPVNGNIIHGFIANGPTKYIKDKVYMFDDGLK